MATRCSRALSPALVAALVACSGDRGAGPRYGGATCELRVGPVPAGPAPAPFEPPLSRVVVDVSVEADLMLRELERAVPKRVLERQRVDVGDAGRLSLQVERGPFSAKLAGDELVVSVDLTADASFCKPLGLLGCVPYASCSPAVRGMAVVPLLLSEGHDLSAARVEMPVTRACTLTALGLDVSSRVQDEANRAASAVRQRIDEGRPAVRPMLEGLWGALDQALPIGGGACVRVFPRGIIQTGPRERAGVLGVGIGLEGEVRVESPCGKGRPLPPMPAPRLDRSVQPALDLHVPYVLGWGEVEQAVARSLSTAEIEAGGQVVHVTDAKASPGAGERLRLVLTVAGKTCGEVALEGSVGLARDGGALRLLALAPVGGGPAAGLDERALAAAVERLVTVPLPVDVKAVPRRVDAAAERLFGGAAGDGPIRPELKVSVARAAVERAVATAEGLVVVVEASGEARVRVVR